MKWQLLYRSQQESETPLHILYASFTATNINITVTEVSEKDVLNYAK